jgi:putative Ca2+/H+ antiporter (TMEM165/GDT1 family)
MLCVFGGGWVDGGWVLVWICVYVCMCVCVCVHIHVCIYTHTCIHTCIHKNTGALIFFLFARQVQVVYSPAKILKSLLCF